MDQEQTINKMTFTLKLAERFDKKKNCFVDRFDDDDICIIKKSMMQVWVAGYDFRTKELQAHHKSKVIQFDLEGNKIAEFESIIEAAKQIGYHPLFGRNAIHNCLKGKYKHTKQGHVWKYAT